MTQTTQATHSIDAQTLFERLIAIRIELDRAKPLYAEYDALVLDLVARGERIYNAPDGQRYEIKDNFAVSNTAFRPAGVKRFELIAVYENKTRKKVA